MTFVEACRAWKAVTGSLPIGITFLVEGEEEDGSKFLPEFVEANKDELKADVALVCDTGMWDQDTPAITVVAARHGLRGSDRALRRSRPAFGPVRRRGAQPDPRAREDHRRRSTTTNGRITIPGFYDGVPETPTQVLEQWKKLNLTEEDFLGQVGLQAFRPARRAAC